MNGMNGKGAIGDLTYLATNYPMYVMKNLSDWSLESVQIGYTAIFDTYIYPNLQTMVRNQQPGFMQNVYAAGVEKIRDVVKSTQV